MQKVICIDSEGTTYLIEGELYTVIGYDDKRYNQPVVFLREIVGEAYCADRFAPISEIDETTFERNYEKEKV